jgi:hypothetical protein
MLLQFKELTIEADQGFGFGDLTAPQKHVIRKIIFDDDGTGGCLRDLPYNCLNLFCKDGASYNGD